MEDNQINYLDSNGFYFAGDINIIPGQNMDIKKITKTQAKNILRSNAVNYIAPEDLAELKLIADGFETGEGIPSSLPPITRLNQVLTTTSLDGKPFAEWRDKRFVPDESSELPDLNKYISGDTLTIPLGKYLPINLYNIADIIDIGENNE